MTTQTSKTEIKPELIKDKDKGHDVDQTQGSVSPLYVFDITGASIHIDINQPSDNTQRNEVEKRRIISDRLYAINSIFGILKDITKKQREHFEKALKK